jgi:hypothetical protein
MYNLFVYKRPKLTRDSCPSRVRDIHPATVYAKKKFLVRPDHHTCKKKY